MTYQQPSDDDRSSAPELAFRSPQLTPAQVEHFQALADATVAKLVRHSELQDSSISWVRAKRTVDGVQMFKGTDAQAPLGTRTEAWTTELFGSVDNVAGMFKADVADADNFRACHAPHQFQAVDGRRLYCLDNTPRQYIGVHYVVTELPCVLPFKRQSIVKFRDWCFLETHAHFNLDDGRQGWVRAFASVALSCCPDVGVAMDVVRGVIHFGGFVFIASSTRPDYIHVTQVQQLDFNGKLHNNPLGDLLVKLDFQRRAKAMAQLDGLLRGYRLGLTPLPPVLAATPRHFGHTCAHCRAKFGLLVPSDHCRKCGLVLCVKCTRVWTLRGRGGGPAVAVRVCKICSLGRHSRPVAATPTSGVHRIRSLSVVEGSYKPADDGAGVFIKATPTAAADKNCVRSSGRPSGATTVRLSADQNSCWSPQRRSLDATTQRRWAQQSTDLICLWHHRFDAPV